MWNAISQSNKKGREILLPASFETFIVLSLLEIAHDLIDDSVKGQIIVVILFQRTERAGMGVERCKITSCIFYDHVSPVAAAASPRCRTRNIFGYGADHATWNVVGLGQNARHRCCLIRHIVGTFEVTCFAGRRCEVRERMVLMLLVPLIKHRIVFSCDFILVERLERCLLYTSDAADDVSTV